MKTTWGPDVDRSSWRDGAISATSGMKVVGPLTRVQLRRLPVRILCVVRTMQNVLFHHPVYDVPQHRPILGRSTIRNG